MKTQMSAVSQLNFIEKNFNTQEPRDITGPSEHAQSTFSRCFLLLTQEIKHACPFDIFGLDEKIHNVGGLPGKAYPILFFRKKVFLSKKD